ncbi:type II CAAX endopeptidase family protein [Methylomonas sp. AM2-LC]|uniref:type II CAAX endopeptidase family protein n=1 Tax=Methylomonas sp. AM2-LC TaxID=3153301 RepID=UPI003263B04A
MRPIVFSLLPLTLLLTVITAASLISYGLLQFTGDIQPIEKIISKTTEVLLILSIFPLKRILKLSWFDLGFSANRIFFKQFLQGFLLSLITLLPVLFSLYALDVHIFDDTRQWTVGKVTGKVSLAFLLALLIALSEEILFRGLLLSALRQRFSIFFAIAISSLYYAALHFLKSKTSIPFTELSINSGFQLMLEAFGNWLNPAILSALLSLFVVGVFLSTIRSLIPQSLGLCIGCHCGWVWQIKTSKDLFNVNPQSDYLFLVSNYDGVVGPMVSLWLSLAIVAFIGLNKRYFCKKEKHL